MTRRTAESASVDITDLRPFVPALYSAVGALRERSRWAGSAAFLPSMATESEQDAEAIKALVELIDQAGAS